MIMLRNWNFWPIFFFIISKAIKVRDVTLFSTCREPTSKMHETKYPALRAVTPIVSESGESMAGSNKTQDIQGEKNGVFPDLNIPKIGMEILKRKAESSEMDNSSRPINIDRHNVTHGEFYLKTPMEMFCTRDDKEPERSAQAHQDLIFEKLVSTEEASENWLTPLPVVHGRVMSPVERMSYIRTVVDDVDDDFMSSSFNSISRSSSFSNSRSISLALARRNLRRNHSGGDVAPCGGTARRATPGVHPGPAGTELMDHLMSLASGENRELTVESGGNWLWEWLTYLIVNG